MVSFRTAFATLAGFLVLASPLAFAATDRLSTKRPEKDPGGIKIRRLINIEKPGLYVVEISSPKANKLYVNCSSYGGPVEPRIAGSIDPMATVYVYGPNNAGTICSIKTWVNDKDPQTRTIVLDSNPTPGKIEIAHDPTSETKKNSISFIVKSEGATEFEAMCNKKEGGKVVKSEFGAAKDGKTVLTLFDISITNKPSCYIGAEGVNGYRYVQVYFDENYVPRDNKF
jgi:hypothetical protein